MFRNFTRKFHNPLHIPKGVDEMVVFGNNSILFTATAVLNQFGRKAYPKITWVYPTFWLDRVHPDYMGLDWGQTIYGMPNDFRKTFMRYRPHYPETKFIEWREFQETRMRAVEELQQQPNLHFHEGEPTAIVDRGNSYEITILRDNDKSKIDVSKQSFFYNWCRYPYTGKPVVQSHTVLYEIPRSEVPKSIIVLGHGLSLIWLLRHFPDTQIINVKRKEDKLPDLPSNRDANIEAALKSKRLVVLLNDDIDIRTDETDRNALVLSHAGDVLHEGPIFSARGLVTNFSLFDRQVPADKIISMPSFGTGQELIGPTDAVTAKLAKDTFIAPKNIPTGSLAHSYHHLMNVTKNLMLTTEPMFFYSKTRHELLKGKAEEAGIALTLEYFGKIDDEVSELDNALNPEASLKLYLDTFRHVYKPNAQEYKIFDEFIHKFFDVKNEKTAEAEETHTTTFKKR
jgi:hypothetical protein